MNGRCVSVIRSRIGLTIQSENGLPVFGRSAGGRVSELTRGSCSNRVIAACVAAT